MSLSNSQFLLFRSDAQEVMHLCIRQEHPLGLYKHIRTASQLKETEISIDIDARCMLVVSCSVDRKLFEGEDSEPK